MLLSGLAAPTLAHASTAISARTPDQVKQSTGYAASQLESKPACGTAAPGRMSCDAQILTVKSTGRPVTLLHVPRATSSSETRAASRAQQARLSSSATGVAAPVPDTPAFLQSAYDLTWLSLTQGTNDTIAVVDAYNDPSAYSDMNLFRLNNGLTTIPQCSQSVTTSCFDEVNQHGASSPPTGSDETGDWNIEESLDLDAVSSVCPLCKILYVQANSDSDLNLQAAVAEAANLGADQISMSFGETTTTSNRPTTWNFGTASALAASGDTSYPGPPDYAGSSNWLGSENSSDTVDVVSYPAALAGVTAVGGTSLSLDNAVTRGADESTWSITTPCSFDPDAANACDGTESGCDTSQSTPNYEVGLTALTAACNAVATAIQQTPAGGRAYNDVSADANPDTGLDIYDSQSGSEGCQQADNTCIVGGTSLATPLTAAFEAVTGTNGQSPAWSYTDGADGLLNDVTSGINGTCPSAPAAQVICNAQSGWDGPTGNGSISGDVVSGAPGIGGTSATSTTVAGANVAGGVYPNGQSTSYWWEYGTSTTYGNSLAQASAGGGTAITSVTGTFSNLQPCTTYHYRLDAENASDPGGVDGVDNTFATAATSLPAEPTSPPTVTGTPAANQALSAQTGTWPQAACSTASYQWQEQSPNGTYRNLTNANSATYTPGSLEAGDYLRVVVTETDSVGSTTASPSAAVGPVVATSNPGTTTTNTDTSTTPTVTITTTPSSGSGSTSNPSPPGTSAPVAASVQPPTETATPTVTSLPIVNGEISLAGGKFANAVSQTIQFYRCAHICTLLSTKGASDYRIRAADAGHYIKLKLTVTGAPGTNPLVATDWIGPIKALSAGATKLTTSTRVGAVLGVEGSSDRALASVRVTRRSGKNLSLAITKRSSARTQVWAFVVSGSSVVSCTPAHVVRGTLRLKVAFSSKQSLKLVAVRG
jgi:hypothetical protein